MCETMGGSGGWIDLGMGLGMGRDGGFIGGKEGAKVGDGEVLKVGRLSWKCPGHVPDISLGQGHVKKSHGQN